MSKYDIKKDNLGISYFKKDTKMLHRENGPARFLPIDNYRTMFMMYSINDNISRWDGPFIVHYFKTDIYGNINHDRYYICDKMYSESDYYKEIAK